MPFRFLDLPAELRNRIYEVAVRMRYESQDVVPIRYRREHNSASGGLHGNFFGLTQTCQQTRSEFRLLYMPSVAISFCLPDLPAFSTTFLSTALDEPRSAPGKIRIYLATDRGVDITHLLRILSSAATPALMIRFAYVPWGTGTTAYALNRVSSNKIAWQKALEHEVSRVLIRKDVEAIEMVMSRCCRMDWVQLWPPKPTCGFWYDDSGISAEARTAAREYLRNLGIEGEGEVARFRFSY